MTQFKHFFISYGRKESLIQAARLHQQLKLKGYEVWFDKVNIPLAEDYSLRIQQGIRNAQNFVFVMAPHSLVSTYCLDELKYAELLGKRIIPLMHIEETDEIKASYSEEERQVRKQVMELLGRRNWLMGREKPGNIRQLDAWKITYENTWKKHEDIMFLKNWEAPFQWESIDKIEEATDKLISLSKHAFRSVYLHTLFLNQAYLWNKQGRKTEDLLVGEERIDAEEWLPQLAQDELPPCKPTLLQAELICTSKKNANNLMTEVFISYSVGDRDLMLKVNDALAFRSITTWIHSHDIEQSTAYATEIYEGIGKSDHFLFFLSKKALQSQWCLEELKHAASLHKHIIVLKIGEYEGYTLPDIDSETFEAFQQLMRLQYIDFTDNIEGRLDQGGKSDFERDIDDIVREVKGEKATYYNKHKVLLTQALRWEKTQRPTFLLQGHNLENAITWLELNKNLALNPPTAIHKKFIETSLKNKGVHPSEVFISYARKDADFARKLNQSLQHEGKFTWFDQESIASGLDFDKEIFKGIDKAYNILLIISRKSLKSEFCAKELEHAAKQNKRFIPILIDANLKEIPELYSQTIPEAYKTIQWIDFTDPALYEHAFLDLVQLLNTDREHVQQHSELQKRALEWEDNGQKRDYLLNSGACNQAQTWLEEAGYQVPEIPLPLVRQEVAERTKQHAQEEKKWHIKLYQHLTSTFSDRYGKAVLATYVTNIVLLILMADKGWILDTLFYGRLQYDTIFTITLGLSIIFFSIILPLQIGFLPQKVKSKKRQSFLKTTGKFFYKAFIGLMPTLLFFYIFNVKETAALGIKKESESSFLMLIAAVNYMFVLY